MDSPSSTIIAGERLFAYSASAGAYTPQTQWADTNNSLFVPLGIDPNAGTPTATTPTPINVQTNTNASNCQPTSYVLQSGHPAQVKCPLRRRTRIWHPFQFRRSKPGLVLPWSGPGHMDFGDVESSYSFAVSAGRSPARSTYQTALRTPVPKHRGSCISSPNLRQYHPSCVSI